MKPKQERCPPQALRFDDQAVDFDRRAGLPADACRAVAEAVAETAENLAIDLPGPLLDLGAGTGEIGVQLAHGKRPYLGLDLSVPMLASFRLKLADAAAQVPGTNSKVSPQVPGTNSKVSPQVPGTKSEVSPQVPGTWTAGTWTAGWLVCADADRRLPLADHSVAVVFSSRAVHLLGLRHLVEEIERLRRPQGALLLLGSVQRRPTSVRQVMRRQMRRLLAQQGYTGRSGDDGRARLHRALATKGWHGHPPRQVAEWTVKERPCDSLEAWDRKTGLAGWALDVQLRRRVLEELRSWARNHYGQLDATSTTTETYQLETLHWPGDT